jgi:hypothetical protein
MIIALLSGNYLKDRALESPEKALGQFEGGDALVGAKSTVLGDRRRCRLASVGSRQSAGFVAVDHSATVALPRRGLPCRLR